MIAGLLFLGFQGVMEKVVSGTRPSQFQVVSLTVKPSQPE